jgi:hypothetical protein
MLVERNRLPTTLWATHSSQQAVGKRFIVPYRYVYTPALSKSGKKKQHTPPNLSNFRLYLIIGANKGILA